MKRIVKYIAKDGSEFDTSEDCNDHDRKTRFVSAIAKFVTDKLSDINDDELAQLSRVWEVVYNDPSSMIAVAEAAQEPKRRGRPKKKKVTISTDTVKNSVDIKNELTTDKVNQTVEVVKVQETPALSYRQPVVPKAWRSLPTNLQSKIAT
jgi:hypothetical protein